MANLDPTRTVNFRSALPSDVLDLVDLIESAYRGDESRLGWTTEADLLEGPRTDVSEVTEVIEAPGSRMILAEADGKLIGCCRLEGRSGDSAYLGMFSVRPTLQGRGVGRAILAEAERLALVELGAKTMTMTVLGQRLELVAWYERLGYRPTGKKTPFDFRAEPVNVAKAQNLEFVELVKSLV